VSGVGAGARAEYVGHVLTVIGLIDGVQVQAESADGQPAGSPALVARVEELIAQRARVGTGGIVTGPASLQEDRTGRATVFAACDGDSGRLGGDPPVVCAVLEGAGA
jgi:hypothetical protein